MITNPDRVSGRVVAVLISAIIFLVSGNVAIPLGLIAIALVMPILFLPLSRLLQAIGGRLGRLLITPVFLLLYVVVMVPYGLLFRMFSPSGKTGLRQIDEEEFDFTDPS